MPHWACFATLTIRNRGDSLGIIAKTRGILIYNGTNAIKLPIKHEYWVE